MVQIHPDPPLTRPGVGGRYEKGSDGAIAQLGERLLCKQEVTGSIPVGSTSVQADGKWRSREDRRERRKRLRSLLASSEVGLGGWGTRVLQLPSRKGPADL